MTLAVRWSQHAADRLRDAAIYIEEQNTGAGHRFVDAVEHALNAVSEFPLAYPSVPGEPHNTRRVLLPHYGYWVVYEHRDDAIVVLTVWHAVRRPGSWRG